MHRSGNRVEGDLFESHIHSFIVKVWLEEPANGTGEAVWRGRITHVPSEESRSLKDVEEISAFVVPYLRSMGVKFRFGPRLADRLRRRIRSTVARLADGLPALQPVEVQRQEPPDKSDPPTGGRRQAASAADSTTGEGGMLSHKS